MTRLAPRLTRRQETTLLPTEGTVQPNNALVFDGANGKVTVLDDTAFNERDTISVAFWAKHTDNVLSGSETYFSKYDTTDQQREWFFGVVSTGHIRIVLSQGGGDTDIWKSDDTLDVITGDMTEWHHYAFVLDFTAGPPTFVVYADGVVVAGSFTSGGLGSILYNGTADLIIGARTGGDFFDGTLHDVRFLTEALSPAQIAAIADQTTSTSTALDTAFHAKGEEIDGTTVYDSSGNANDGTVAGGVTQSTDALYSFANRVGHTLTAGVIIPRDESATAFDVLGASLGVVAPGALKSGKAVGLDILGPGVLVVIDIEDQTLTYTFSSTGGVESRFPYRLPIRIKSISLSTTAPWASIIGLH